MRHIRIVALTVAVMAVLVVALSFSITSGVFFGSGTAYAGPPESGPVVAEAGGALIELQAILKAQGIRPVATQPSAAAPAPDLPRLEQVQALMDAHPIQAPTVKPVEAALQNVMPSVPESPELQALLASQGIGTLNTSAKLPSATSPGRCAIQNTLFCTSDADCTPTNASDKCYLPLTGGDVLYYPTNGQSCLDKASNDDNNCTANDNQLSVAGTPVIVKGCNFVGDYAIVSFVAHFEATASDRYDYGLWINSAGGNAKTDTAADCTVGVLPATPTTFSPPPVGPYQNTNSNSCGDVKKGTGVYAAFQNIRVACVNPDSNGFVQPSFCTSWGNNAASTCNLTTTPPNLPLPDTKSKCSCGNLPGIPVRVPGKIVVKKTTNPNPDPSNTSFDYNLSGGPAPAVNTNFSLTNAGTWDSNTTGGLALYQGTYTLNELTLPSGWNFTNLTCSTQSGGTSTTTTSGQTATINLKAGDTVTCTYTNTASPTLAITKTVDNTPVSAGDQIGFTINVANNGTGNAFNVAVSDTLPTGTGISWSINPAVSGCSITSGVLSCSFATLAPGASKSIHVVSSTTPSSCGIYNNTATFTSTNGGSGGAQASVNVQCPNVSVLKTAASSPINAGDTATFNITVTSSGPGTARSVTLSDTLPSGTWTIGGANAGSCSIAAGVLSCSFGDMLANTTKTITLSRTTTAADCGTISNTATVSATNEPTGSLSDNSSSASITVNCADVKVVKTANPSSISAGSTASFSLVISNIGAGTARNVTLSDTLPSGTWTISGTNASSCNGGVSTVSGTLSCSFGDLAPGATRTITLSRTTTGADCGALKNTATVATTYETNTANNSSSASINVNCGSIQITKTPDASSVSAGDNIGFTITVTNSGAGDATGVTLTDTLPTNPGLSWTIGTPTGSGGYTPPANACSTSGGVLTCNFGTMTAGSSVSVHITSPTTSATCGEVDNTASVTTTNDGSASADTKLVVNCPDLTVTKTAANSPINAGDTASFSLVVSNIGAGTARSVTLNDTLPSGTWSIGGADGGSCSITAGVLNCSFGDLAPNATRTVTLSRATTAADCGTISNTATVSATNEANTANNSSTATITVLCPDVTVTKSANNSPINAGDTASFNLVVQNIGLGTAKNVTLSDTLPTGTWSIGGADGGSCSITAGVLNCSFGDLAPNATRTVTLSRATTAADCGTISNTATVSATNEANTANNSSTATITVLCPDVTVTKSANNSPINAGDTASFNLVVQNIGLGTARNVTLSDTLPSGTWSIGGADGGSCSITAGVLNCSFGDLAPNATRTVTLSRATTAVDCGTISNTATVSASNEANTANNSATATITVQCPNVTVTKTADNSPISAGDTAAFTIVVSNPGQGVARNVTVNDTLPSGVTWTINAPASGCSITAGVLSCSLGDLASGDSVTIKVSGQTSVANCGTLSNTATVAASNEPIGSLGDNSSTADITVNCADVKVVKTANPGSISAGDTASFNLVVSNIGAGTARSVTLSDTLPSGTWTIGGADGGSCSISAGVLNCSFGDLAPGATRTVTLSRPTTSADCGTISNTATVATTYETNTANNSSMASIIVNCAQIQLTKTPDNGTVSAGDNIGFTLTVTNGGAGNATGVTLTDTLPTNAGLAWSISGGTYASIAGNTCSIASGTLTCGPATLAPGASYTVHITSPTTSATCGEVDNTATVMTANDGSASAPAKVTVNCPNLTVAKTAANSPINAGDTASFSLVVSNIGAGTARNVTLNDTLPSGTWSIGGTNGGSCSITAGVLNCSFGDLAPNATRTVTLSRTTTAADCGTITNTATVSASNEADTSNNSSTATITVQCSDVKVSKTADNSPISAGDTAAFTIVVSNIGAGTAYNVTVNDTLPSGVTWTISPTVTGCSITGNSLSCSFASLASGGSIPIHVSGQTDAADCGTLSNTVTVGASNETNTANNSATATITVNCPDLKVTKTAANSPISAGDLASFSILVSNIGAGTARNVTLSDTLPSGTWSIGGANGGSCSITAGVLNCDFGDLAPNATRTVTLSRTTTAADCGTITNTATVSASNEANTANNSSTATITVQCPNVMVTKTADNSPINAGDTAAFTIVVSNVGTGTAYNVTVNDTLPSGVTWTISPTVTGCSITGNTLSCSFASLASGGSVPIHVSGQTSAANCGTLSNTATVAASNEPIGSLGDNSSTADITVNCADVKVVKTANPGSISAGDTASFNLVVSNIGAGTARSVTLSDTLPSGTWTIGGADGGACSITAGVLNCSFGDLAPGATRTVTLSRPTTSADCGTISNTATVATTYETNTANNSSTASIIVNCAQIQLTKTPDNGTVSAGDNIGFTLTVTNGGAGNATGVTLTDTLPTNAGLSWTVGAPTGSGGYTPPVNACSIASGVLTCNFGTMPPNSSVSVHITSPTTSATCGEVDNTATVMTANDGSASAPAKVTVNCPNLTVAKTAANSPISAGDTASFNLVVSNIGAGTARNVTLNDTLPSGTWSIGGANGGSCSITAGVLNCSFGDLAPNATRTVTLSRTTTAADCGTITNTATVSASNEADTSNNSSTATITVQCSDVKVSKTADNSPISAGDTAAFTIVVSNIGAGTAYNVTVNDTLPSGVTWTISPTVTGCSITGNSLSCSFASLASGGSIPIHVSGQTDAADCGTLSNTVTVAASNETNTANNSATATITVNCPDLKVTKTAANSPISAGDLASFSILVSNIGAGTARNVTLSDTLPSGTWSIGGANGGSCSITAGVLNCDFGDLAPGATRTVTLSRTTTAADCGTISNTATVSASNEANTSNNSSTATITIQCADVRVVKTTNPGTISAGDTASFSIVVSNIGAGTARNVTLSDTLPSGTWSIGGADGGSCSITAGVLSCSFGDLANGDTRTVTLSRPTTSADCGTISNTATVATTYEKDSDKTNNSSTSTIAVNCGDIRITKTPDAASVSAGDNIGFTITVTNNGEGNAYGVTVTDVLPSTPGLNWSINGGTYTGIAGNSCAITSGTLTCGPATLAPGASYTVHIASPTTSATCGEVDNTASVTTSNDGSASAPAKVIVSCPNVTVTKTADNSPISAGDTAAFTIVVRNTGAGTAYNVTIADQLPDGVTWSINPAVTGCSITGNTLGCSFTSLASSAAVTIHVSGVTTSADCGTLSNTVTVGASNEAKTDDNTANATITVNCPDVTVTKTAANSPISAGDTASFSILVSNIGAGTARNVTLSDTLPSGTWTIGGANGGSCSITAGVLNCAFGDLAPGATRTVTLSRPTTSADCGTISNTATVSASNEANTANNSSTATITVQCPNVTVSKTADQPTVMAGNPIGFTITATNNGQGNAYGFTLTDILPTGSGISWTISPAVQGCSITSNVLTCGPTTLAAGAKLTVHVTSRTTANSCGTYNNTASYSTTNGGSGTSNQASIYVACPKLTLTKTADPTTYTTLGQQITYTYKLTNDGNIDLHPPYKVTDDHITPPNSVTCPSTPDPLKPGDSVTCTATYRIQQIDIDNGYVTNTAIGSATLDGQPVTSNPDQATITLQRAPKPPSLIQSGSTYYQVPVLGAIGNTKSGVDWVIEAQNLGSTWTKVALLLFAENSGFCQPQAQNPFKIECSGMLKPGTSWVWTASQLPASAKSAIAISYNPSADSGNPYWRCEDWTNTLNKLSWPEGWPSVNPLPGQFPFNWNPFYGEPIGIEVTRRGPGNSNPSLTMASSYSAVSAKGDGRYDPLFGGFAYYAPTLYNGYNGWVSWLYIQNSGSECTSVELWFKAQDDCLRSQICSVAQLSPGYTAQFNVSGCVPTGFTGSVWIRASQPLGIIVDQIGQDVLMSYTGSPGSLCYIFNGQCLDLQGGSTVAYGPLIYRETNGWGTSIHVQNMSGVTAAKVKVYFMDQSGDIITTLVDWVCPRGETSFPLTLVSNLPGNYVGAVRVESQAWQSPGDPNVNASPIAAVAELLNYSSPTKITQAAAYNLFPQEQTYLWQIGAGDASGLESGVGLIGIPSLMQRGNSLNLVTDLAIQNVVPKPGFTDFVVYVYDQNGLIDYVCEKLNEKQVEYVNLDNWDWIRPGFVGSAVISAVYWEHDVLTGVPIFGPSNPQLPILLRNVVGLAAVKVERVIPSTSGPGLVGDLSTASEGFPMPPGFDFEGYTPQCPGVPTSCGSAPLNITICEPVYGQAVVTVVDDSTGAQAFQGIPDANGVVAVPAVLTGRTYKITVADPGKDYVTYTGQGYTARVPAISAVILAPCQSQTPAVPYSVSLTPPTGVVEGYEFLGRTPTGVTNNNGVWSGAPQNPAAGVQLQLWLAPTAANQPGTYLQTAMTNTEGYFKFSNLNPCLLYELKFTGDNAVVVIPGVAATIAGQKYMVSATAGIYPPGPLPLP
ncbi:MAG: DUF11 domain-containing protein [Anaerolineae bacterium]